MTATKLFVLKGDRLLLEQPDKVVVYEDARLEAERKEVLRLVRPPTALMPTVYVFVC